MKKKEASKEFDLITDQIESFLGRVPVKDKRYWGVNLCMFTAGVSAKEMNEESSPFDIFDPLRVLSEADKRLQALIAEQVDEFINDEIKESIKN